MCAKPWDKAANEAQPLPCFSELRLDLPLPRRCHHTSRRSTTDTVKHTHARTHTRAHTRIHRPDSEGRTDSSLTQTSNYGLAKSAKVGEEAVEPTIATRAG